MKKPMRLQIAPQFSRGKLVLLLTVLLISGCSSRQPSDALQKEIKTIVSWVGATRMVAESWQNNVVPSAYARRAFQTAQDNLQQEAQTIQKLTVPEAEKLHVASKLKQVQDSLWQARVAVQNEDRARVAATIAELTGAQQTFQSAMTSQPSPAPAK